MFDYFYGNEPKQYAFYSIPQLLFTDDKFKKISCESKVLYGLLLDKSGLSVKNGWTDKDGKVYVYYKREDVCEMLGCKKDKASKLLAELDDEKGIGLIKRVPQGQGKPAKIYVRHFLREIDDKPIDSVYSLKNPDVGSENKTDVKRAEFPPSRKRKNRPQESGNSDVLTISQTKGVILSESTSSINQQNAQPKPPRGNDRIDKIDYLDKVEEIRERISADNILACQNIHGRACYAPDELDELVELIAWAELTTLPALKINGANVDIELVRIRFAKLTEDHIEYVLDCLSENIAKISQRRNYLLTCLYNAPLSMSGYIANRVNRDLSSAGDGG